MDVLPWPPSLLQMVFSASHFIDIINADLPLSVVSTAINGNFHIILLSGTSFDVSIAQSLWGHFYMSFQYFQYGHELSLCSKHSVGSQMVMGSVVLRQSKLAWNIAFHSLLFKKIA